MLKHLSPFVYAVMLAACGSAATMAAPTVEFTSLPPTQPVTFEGRMIYTAWEEGLLAYDGSEVTPLFVPEGDERVLFADVSFDGRLVVMAVAAEPGADLQPGPTSLYVMPLTGGEAALALAPDEGERFTLPVWSPDGAYIYYTVERDWSSPAPGTGAITLERIGYPDGEREIVAENAFWANFSPDGEQMAYVGRAEGMDSLIIAEADATSPTFLLEPGAYPAVDAPTFTPDGTGILFSAITGTVEAPSEGWFADLFGVKVARAHQEPSDVFLLPFNGEPETRLTNIQDFGLYPAYSPDGESLGLLRGSGLYVMQPDGEELTRLLPPGPAGTLDWVP